MRPNESYPYDGGDYEELSGTLMQSDKPVAVTSESAVSDLPEEAGNLKGGVVSEL